jgi:hypothetical protein
MRTSRRIRSEWLSSLLAILSVVGCRVDSGGLPDPGRIEIGPAGGARASGGIASGGVGGSSRIGTGGDSLSRPVGGAGGVAGSDGIDLTGAGGSASAGTGGMASGVGGGVREGGDGTGGLVSGTGGMIAGPGGRGDGLGGAGIGRGGGPSGAGGAGGAGGSTVESRVGCADGTREAFAGLNRFPQIAGCAGAWTIPGVLMLRPQTTRCMGVPGNSGTNPTGVGCAVDNLCADGWHVCAGAAEIDDLGVDCAQAGISGANSNAGPQFFVTRQRGSTGTACMRDEVVGSNNLHGCGNFGLPEDQDCAPLDRQLSHSECDDTPPWSCDDPNSVTDEGLVVLKRASNAGGVLCCR